MSGVFDFFLDLIYILVGGAFLFWVTLKVDAWHENRKQRMTREQSEREKRRSNLLNDRIFPALMVIGMVGTVIFAAMALTMWIWRPKAWPFSLFIAICIIGGLREWRKGR